MHRLAMLAALAGCLGEKTKTCKNGAVCPFDEVCTEVPITEGATLCGTPRLVDACEGKDEFIQCDYTSAGSADGTCLSEVCTECQSIDVTGCRAPGWNRMTSSAGVRLLDVWLARPSEAYAVGEMRTLLHYDGRGWSSSTIEVPELMAGASLRGVWRDGATVYAAANGGQMLALQNGTWSTVYSAGVIINAMAGASSNLVAVGSGGTVVTFDGAWSKQTLSPPAPLNAVWVADDNDAIAVGAQGIIFRRVNGTWTVDRPAQSEPPLRAVWGRSMDDVYAVGERLSPDGVNILHYENGMWVRVTPSSISRGTFLTGVWGTADGHVFAVGQNGAIVHFDGTTWLQRTISGDPQLEAIDGTSFDNVIAVGSGGTILRFTGSE